MPLELKVSTRRNGAGSFHQLIDFRRDNRERFINASIRLFPVIPNSREGKPRASPEFTVDRKLFLAVSAPLAKTVDPVEQMTWYEVSPIPRAMYWAYSSAIAILGNDSVVRKRLVAPFFKMISTIGDDFCLTVISILDSRCVRFIVYWPPVYCSRHLEGISQPGPDCCSKLDKNRKFEGKLTCRWWLECLSHLRRLTVLKNQIDIRPRRLNNGG